jgi:hypothetical protein
MTLSAQDTSRECLPSETCTSALYDNFDLAGPSQNIRLLDLQESPVRSKDSDKGVRLHGSLRVVSLADQPRYVALSYVWGASTLSRPYHRIQIGNQKLRITRNCEAALYTILKEQGPVAIWVDSICIDQSSLSERNHQIGLMGSIYERAHTVLVWLSPDSPLLPASLEYVKTLIEDGQFENSEARHDILKHFLENEWFSRGWTYQEFVLASNPVFLTHAARLSWTELIQAAEKLHQRGAMARWHMRGKASYTPLVYDLLSLIDIWRTVATSRGTMRVTHSFTVTASMIAGDWLLVQRFCFFMAWIRLIEVFLAVLTVLQGPASYERRPSIYTKTFGILTPMHDTLNKRLSEIFIGNSRLYNALLTIPRTCSSHFDSYTARVPWFVAVLRTIWNTILDIFVVAYTEENYSANGVVQSIRRRSVTNPKDKAFAYYGVLQTLGARLTIPNYATPAHVIHQAFFVDLLRWNSCSLALLVEAGVCGHGLRPSWVPKWHSPGYRSWVPESLFFHATVGNESSRVSHYGPAMCRVAERSLTVQGFMMYEIVDVVKLPDSSLKERNAFIFDCRLIRSIVQWIMSARLYCSKRDKFRFSRDLSPMIAAVLLLLAHTDTNVQTRQFQLSFEQWWRVISLVGPQEEHDIICHCADECHICTKRTSTIYANSVALKLQQYLRTAVENDRVLVTLHTGDVAVAAAGTKKGDSVYRVSGVPLPMVLRERKWKALTVNTAIIEAIQYEMELNVVGPSLMSGEVAGSIWDRAPKLLVLV